MASVNGMPATASRRHGVCELSSVRMRGKATRASTPLDGAHTQPSPRPSRGRAARICCPAGPVRLALDPVAVRSPVLAGGELHRHAIFLVDDDQNLGDAVRVVLDGDGCALEEFETGEASLAAYTPGTDGCLLLAIVITGSSDVPMAVQAIGR